MLKLLSVLAVVFAIAEAISYEQFQKKYCFQEDDNYVCANFNLTKDDLDDRARSDFELSKSGVVSLRNCQIDYLNENLVSLFPDANQLYLENCIVSLNSPVSIDGKTKNRNSVLHLSFEKCDIRDNLNSFAFRNLRDLQTVSIRDSTLHYPYIDEYFVKKDRFEFSLIIENTKVNFQRGLLSKIHYLDSVACNFCQLKEIDSLFKGKTTIRTASFVGNKLTRFPKSFHNQELLESIDLSSNEIAENLITRDHFKFMRNLNILNLNENKKIGGIGYLAFNDTNLKDLLMSNVSLQTLDKLGCKELVRVDFSHNKITEVGLQVFEDLGNLMYLHLSYNAISKLDESVFKSLTNLQKLNLNSNLLEELPRDVFSNLQTLVTLNLRDNLIKIIYPDRLFPNNLYSLDISNNPFALMEKTYFSNLTELDTLDISNTTDSGKYFDNQILKPLKNLSVLKMRNNQIKNIENIFLPTNLTFIDLGSNQIANISNKVFENLDLQFVDLTNNPIPKVEFDLLVAKFSKVTFYGN